MSIVVAISVGKKKRKKNLAHCYFIFCSFELSASAKSLNFSFLKSKCNDFISLVFFSSHLVYKIFNTLLSDKSCQEWVNFITRTLQ